MKFFQLFMLAFLSHFIAQDSFAQTATVNCSNNSITVTNLPPYPTVYMQGSFLACRDGGGFYAGCDEDGRPACCRSLPSPGTPSKPRIYLEQLQYGSGSWLEVEGPQTSTVFNNLAKGTYRIKVQNPDIAENACGTDKFGNIIRGRTCLFNDNGQFIGYLGTWDNSPFGGTPPTYSNTVTVGVTDQSDIAWNFIDANGNDLFNPGEPIRMNTTGTKNYDAWWVAIFENGGQNRWWSNYWTEGQIPGDQIDLNALTSGAFQSGTNDFAQIPVSYTVQFAISAECNTSWTNLNRNFAVCPSGLGCRIAENEEIRVFPNPANHSFQLLNYDVDITKQQRIVLMDMNGRIVKSFEHIGSPGFDISDLANGLYLVSIWENGNRLLTTKLSIVK
ncbi:MAG: T9SS type A sorting domain-containing protein [Phaeodactylibacter sp.]|uniref:T9SS type A sorting domain-containing protein n=1 Tax=Phaeodactylibacter sp. TaxID=1940289 RepID=UPI0032EBD79B